MRTGRSASGRCRAVLLIVASCWRSSRCRVARSHVDAKRDPVTLRIRRRQSRQASDLRQRRSRFRRQPLSESLVGIGWDGRTPTGSSSSRSEWSADRPDPRHSPAQERAVPRWDAGRQPARQKASRNQSSKSQRQVPTSAIRASTASNWIAESDLIRIRLSRRESLLLADLVELNHPASDQPEIGLGPFKLVTRQPKVQAGRVRRLLSGPSRHRYRRSRGV